MARRPFGERIIFQQREHIGRALKQAEAEVHEPRVLPVVAQRGEPHLPVQSRLVRLDEAGTTLRVAGFPFEFVRQPGDAVIAALDDDFVARPGHHAEQTVGVQRSEWPDGPRQLHDRLWPGKVDAKVEQHFHSRDQHDESGERPEQPDAPDGRRVEG